jgi:predicted enzyme related to lactoylglutathione lyase
MKVNSNPVGYFEIPVIDLDRAIEFYNEVFGYEFFKEVLDGIEMAFFPFDKYANGITGALAKGEIYKPTKSGALLYFNTNNIDQILDKVNALNAKILYPKTSVGEYGFVAEFEDSEGNRIGLTEK